jgi:hypothetical protein
MRSRARLLRLAAGLALASGSLTGCAADGPRSPGDPVTAAEAEVLAELLQRNYRAGGADFVVTVPYDESVVLTLTGEIDFRDSVGRAEVSTSFGDGSADDVRTLVFTPEDLWFGNVPGLSAALAGAGLPDAAFVHRPVAIADGAVTPDLVDVLVTVLLNLSTPTADDPEAFLGGDYTWQGQRSIDSRLTSLYGLREGRTVAVAAADDRLVQYVTPLDGLEVTVTLAAHGPRTVAVPAAGETAEAAHVPEVAAQLGG